LHEKVEEMYRKTTDKGMEEWKKEGGKSRVKSVGSVDNAVANERTITVVEDLGRALQADGVEAQDGPWGGTRSPASSYCLSAGNGEVVAAKEFIGNLLDLLHRR
jgi:hypothetical protein